MPLFSSPSSLLGFAKWALGMAQYAASVIDERPSAIIDVTLRLQRAMSSGALTLVNGSATTMLSAIWRLEQAMLSHTRMCTTAGDTFDAARELLFVLSMRLRCSKTGVR